MKGGDLKASDFSLKSTSPLINKGIPLDAEFADALDCDISDFASGKFMLGDQDTQGSGWEIGADIYIEDQITGSIAPPKNFRILIPN